MKLAHDQGIEINCPDGGATTIILDGDTVRLKLKKFYTFYKNPRCSYCGMKAAFIAKQKDIYSKGNKFHLALYGYHNEQEVLMTCDHIIPKSKGRTNSLNNLQTLCEHCNNIKSTKIITNADLIWEVLGHCIRRE